MKRRLVLGLIGGVVALSIGLFLFFVSPQMRMQKSLLKIMSDHVDLQVNDIRFVEVGPGGIKLEVIADSAQYQKKEGLAVFNKVRVRIMTPEGHNVVMEGDKGTIKTESRDMDIEGNVKVVSGRGDYFYTDQVTYKNSEQMISTKRPIEARYGNITVKGVGMTASIDGKRLEVLSGVKATAVLDFKGER